LYDLLSLDDIEHPIDCEIVKSLRLSLSEHLGEQKDLSTEATEFVKELSKYIVSSSKKDSELQKMLKRCVNSHTLSVFTDWINYIEKMFQKYNFEL
jgi:hypothetical protein